ncbi:MAG: peptidase M23 [Betaproteobacteria bacterium HGW-Betaproteobacteria-16]|nr:MAG: peptidase M23 [Betaproteobacteria bacterium HGW-Betaproteobacteria-16]
MLPNVSKVPAYVLIMTTVDFQQLKALIQSRRRPIGISVGALLLGTGAVAFGVSPALSDASKRSVQQIVEPLDRSAPIPDLSVSTLGFFIHQSHLVRVSDTVQSMLSQLGIDDRDAQTYLTSDGNSRLLMTKAPGKLASVTRTPEGRLQALSVRWVDTRSKLIQRLVVERQDSGFSSRLEQLAPRRLVQLGSGTIRSSFYAATDQAGIPDGIAAQTVEAFSGDIDFQRQLQRGARFNLVYEAFEFEGEIVSTGQLLGAEIQNGRDVHQAMWFQTGGKGGEFVNLDGTSQRKTYLASPLAFSRVTSSYGLRTHPVFGVKKAHKGTDYGAPAGTPVRTVADGIVTFAGKRGGYGNYVVVRHPDQAATAYAHLGRIGVRIGQRVSQGQHIGSVGSTGITTGPNLHFEYLVKGVRTNPSRITNQQTVSASVVATLPTFQQEAKAMRAQLVNAGSMLQANAQ